MLLFNLLALKTCLAIGIPPIIIAQPLSRTVLLSGSATFQVSVFSLTSVSYQWFKNGSKILDAEGSSYGIYSATTNDAGAYSVVVVNAGGSVGSSAATLTVLVPPTITTQPQSVAVSVGQTASFSVGAGGTSPLNYQWKLNGTNLSGANNASLTLTNVQTNQAGSYAVVLTNLAGSVTSAVATLTVLVPPAITHQPQSLTVTQGQTAAFSVGASGTAPISYQWSFNGTNVSGANNATLTLTNVQTNLAGNYAVVLTNLAGSVTSAVATLSVLVPPTITHQPQSQTLSMGQAAAFYVRASGTATMGYQWSFNGTALSGATNAALALIGVHATNAGSYTVVVTNLAGLVTSVAATLMVTNPSINLSVASGTGMNSSGFTFQLSVPVGITYVILTSTNFQDWTPIATNVAQTGNEVFTDAAATNYSSRFYRALTW